MFLSRQRIATLVAELVGTFILTFTVLSVSKSALGIPYFVAVGAGLALTILVMTIGKTSGAHVNPAVTFGLWSARKISTVRALAYIVSQFIGAAFAWRMYTYLLNDSIPSIASGKFDWRILIAEALGAAIFTFGIASAVYQKYEGGKLAATIGGSLVLGILAASVLANSPTAQQPVAGVINPAVALGIQSWSKEYVIGPLLGALVGVNLYALLFAGESLNVKRAPAVVATKSKTAKKPTKKTARRK